MTALAADRHRDERFLDEAMLLGALLHYGDPTLYRSAAAIVSWEHFADAFNAKVFGIIGESFEAGLTGFPLMAHVNRQLRGDPTIEEMQSTPSKMIGNFIACAGPAISVEACARQIKWSWLNDGLKQAVEDEDTETAESHAAEMERLSRAHLVKDEGVQRIDAAGEKVVARLQEAFAAGAQRDDTAWPGSHGLARVLGGFRRGRMYVIGGRPGAGKTTAGLSLLLRTALKGHGVLFVELEMGADELTEMALCDLAWNRTRRIEYRDLSGNKVTDIAFQPKFEAVIEAQRNFEKMPFMISDRPGLTIAEIRSQAAQYAQRLAVDGKRLDVICVDHLNLIKASTNYKGNKVAETEEVSNQLKALAKELQCAVVVLAQLNRGVESRDDKRPGLADLRWTGAIEQDADVVLFVYREAYYLSKPIDDPVKDTERKTRLAEVEHKMEFIFAKHRGGPTPTVEMFCDMGCAVVRDSA